MNAISEIYLRLFISFFIALFLSFLLANTWDNPKENNDIKAYSNHYSCLESGIDSIDLCSGEIGYPVDFIYELSVYLFKFVFGGSFLYFIFFISFSIYFGIIYLTSSLSGKVFWFSVPFLLTDFRFYELGNNVLRNGLAVILVLYAAFLMIRNFRFSCFFKFIPVFAHVTAIPFVFVLGRIFSVYFYLIVFFVSVFFSVYFNKFLYFLYPFFPDSVQGKLHAYGMISKNSPNLIFNLPLHYAGIVLIGLFFLTRIDSKKFAISFNFSFVFLMFAIVFDKFGVGYRFLNYLVPFLAILVASYVEFFNRQKLLFVYFNVVLFYMLFISILLLKNFDSIVRGFE